MIKPFIENKSFEPSRSSSFITEADWGEVTALAAVAPVVKAEHPDCLRAALVCGWCPSG
jgi:hypothetical protein